LQPMNNLQTRRPMIHRKPNEHSIAKPESAAEISDCFLPTNQVRL
jgi:hypothetical protein